MWKEHLDAFLNTVLIGAASASGVAVGAFEQGWIGWLCGVRSRTPPKARRFDEVMVVPPLPKPTVAISHAGLFISHTEGWTATPFVSNGTWEKAARLPPPSVPADAVAVRGAGFGSTPQRLNKANFGRLVPSQPNQPGPNAIRQKVLIECLAALEEASPTARYHKLAQANLERWRAAAEASRASASSGKKKKKKMLFQRKQKKDSAPSSCEVRVCSGDWGQVTHAMTKEYGVTFAALNMANAYAPGGGYVEGMVAQEENMYRRTDCHFSLDRKHMDERLYYLPEKTALLSAADGRVYLDTECARVCIRGPEDRARADLGYDWLADDEVFPFYELRAAALDLRNGAPFDERETAKRVVAQLETLIEHNVRHAVLSAFGCGAFLNPAERVAAIYRRELAARASHFDVVAFAIFHAGYGPDNFTPFQVEFQGWA